MTNWKNTSSDAQGPPPDDDALRKRLNELVQTRNVRTAFQPIVDLHDGSIAGYEALTRPGAESGYAGPAELFEDAASFDMLWALEELTRRSSIESAGSWPENVRLFLNCTPDVIADARFQAEIQSLTRPPSKIRPQQVVLEVTELSEEQHVEGLYEQVTALKKLGVELAIDDVGAGTSGLNRIMLLRPQWLKLDREFIRSIDTDLFKQNMVRFFVHFARLSCVNVIAEGVEKREELAMVASLGVRFAQGFYLARPASREQAEDPGYAADVRDRWSHLEPVFALAPGVTPLRRLCHTATVVQSETSIGSVAGMLLRSSGVSGVVVQCGRRFVGWCSRERVLSEARLAGSRREISAVTSIGTCTISPDASIHDALHLVSVREESELLQPIVLAELGEVVGIVNVRDILDAAVLESRTGFGGRMPLTGLPGRARADQFLASLMERSAPLQPGPAVPPVDVAYIDVRRFTDYNGAFGYELGDQLIRALADMLRDIVVQGETPFSLFHLGDDRFVVAGPSNLLEERIRAVMNAFDRAYSKNPISGAPDAEEGPDSHKLVTVMRPSGVCLRVLLVPHFVTRVRTHRELHRVAQQLRQRSGRDERQPENQDRSVLVSDTRGNESAAVRKSA